MSLPIPAHLSALEHEWIVVNVSVLHNLPDSAMPEKLSLNWLWRPSRSCGQKGRTPGRQWHPRTQHIDKPGHGALWAMRKLLHCSTDPLPFAIPSPNSRGVGKRGCLCVTQPFCFFLLVAQNQPRSHPPTAFAHVLTWHSAVTRVWGSWAAGWAWTRAAEAEKIQPARAEEHPWVKWRARGAGAVCRLTKATMEKNT